MQMFQFESFPLEQVTNLTAAEQRWGGWNVARPYPKRLIALSRSFSMRSAIRRVQTVQRPMDQFARATSAFIRCVDEWTAGQTTTDPIDALHAIPPDQMAVLMELFSEVPVLQQALLHSDTLQGDDRRIVLAALADAMERTVWRLPWMKEAVRFFEALENQFLRASTYLFVTWEPKDVTAQAQATTLQNTIGRPVHILDYMPSVLEGDYEEHATYLAPTQPGQPWYSVLHAYDMQDEWDAATLHALLLTSYDVAIAVDYTTMARAKAQRVAELSYNASRIVMSDKNVLDTRAQRAKADAEYALHEIRHETLHEIQIAVLVGGATREELEQNTVETRDRLSPKLRLMRCAGAQGEVIKFFGTTPRTRIEAPLKPRTQLSHAVGCMFGILGLHRVDSTEGVFLGIDAMRQTPIFMDLFKNNQAAHAIVLGKSGYGKTVFINLLAERAAAVNGMQVIGIDAFRNGFRVEQALSGAKCYAIGLEHTINIFDVVFSAETEGGWEASQVLHVVSQLSLLLGQPGRNNEGKQQYTPRIFSTEERGVLGRVVSELYGDNLITPDTPTTGMPTLSGLVDQLEKDDDEVALRLALLLRYFLYGRNKPGIHTLTPEGKAFNGHTTIDWNFGRDVIYYDFSQVPEMLLPFFYVQAIGAIWRYVRKPGRDLSRKIFLQIDEYGYASQVESVQQLAFDIAKTARKYGCGLVLVDQNPTTFFASETGRKIYEQAAARVLYHLDDLPAREVGAAMSDLTPQHIELLPELNPGTCIAVIKNDVYVINTEMHPLEKRAFIGS